MPPTALANFDFIGEDGNRISGLVSVRAGDEEADGIDELLALREARLIKDVDYIFFRRFSDGRSSQIAAYVIDNTSEHLDEQSLAGLHKRVWLHGGVPLIYVAWPTRVDVLSCARGPDFWVESQYEYKPAERLMALVDISTDVNAALAEKRARYSAWRLADGTFWEDPNNAWLAKSEHRSHERLIQAVVDTDEALDGKNRPLLRHLLLLMVLIKYLEDRRVFPERWFELFGQGATSFLDVLRLGDPSKCLKLLAQLAERFQGDIFTLPDTAETELTAPVLRAFASLVEAKTIKDQRYLWEQFSFEHIPVEIISHLYQRFVKGGHGTVYTPPFLAALLLDHAMPYEQIRGDERVLDPACGSGVFLVGAFRRLVSVWRFRRGWAQPDVPSLNRILHQSIFGIELDPQATDLASFSLSLAVCDGLQPKVIWSDLKFSALRGKNLFQGDFFEEVEKGDDSNVLAKKFDVVVGNPPFESELTDPGKRLNARLKGRRGALPDKQAAYLFLEQGVNQLVPGGRLCLVQPSGLLYNRKAANFRRKLIADSKVVCVLDFTSIRNLFGAADPKTAAFLIVREDAAKDHRIVHLTFRRTFGTKQKIAFELDHYDWHSVPQQVALDDVFIWRLNLLGGGRLIAMSRRFREMRSLKELVESNSLDFGEGFIVGNGKKEAGFLHGMRLLPSDALKNGKVDVSLLDVVTRTHFEGPRSKERYSSPRILFLKKETLPTAFWDYGDLAYSSSVVGIGLGQCKNFDLQSLHAHIETHHPTYRLCSLMHGSKAFVAKATALLKQDIDGLPFPEDTAELDLSYWEEAIQKDVIHHMCHFIRRGQESALLKRAAGEKEVGEYSSLFCRMLKSVYKTIESHPPVMLDGLICQPFSFEEARSVKIDEANITKKLNELIHVRNHESFRTIRVLRFYMENVILVVKPDRLRYWIQSTAIRDADDTVIDLRGQGH